MCPTPKVVIREVAVVDVKYIFTYIKDAMAQGSTAVAELPRDALQVRLRMASGRDGIESNS